MSNFFNANSRFAALLDDDDVVVTAEPKSKKREQSSAPAQNSFKNAMHPTSNPNPRPRSRRYKDEDADNELAVKEFEQKVEERRIQESLKLDFFPSLGEGQPKTKTQKQDTQKQDTQRQDLQPKTETFVDKLRKANSKKKKVEEQDEDMINVRPGCIVLKRDPVTRQTIVKGLEEAMATNHDSSTEFHHVLSALATLHKNRTQAYIEQYGYDLWEKMYRFPNYDYDYFNRLDENFYHQEQERENDYRDFEDTFYNNNY